MGSYVCVYILVFCIFINFYFRSLVSCGLNSQSTRHKRSKVKGDLDTKYKNTDTKQRNSQYPRRVLCTVSSYVCVYILVFCIFITFYFRSLVSCVLWVPLFVFIFLYFVSLSPFISDLLCLVNCKYKNINKNRGTQSTQDTRDLK
jgi:hypothetical protein